MMACPPAEQLLDFAAGRLSDDSQASVETHIDSCVACRSSLSSLAKNDPANESFGRYKLETVLGSGGMGIVYRAWDPQLARPVAIKVVRQAGNDTALRERLRREAQSLARLSHPNVCHVYDVGEEADEVWIAMELVDGVTLRQWAQSARGSASIERSQDELLAVLLGAAEGIAAAHASGLIHRDIKPENVLVTREGKPVVTDFGLARIDLPVDPNGSTMSGDPLLTATGAIVGTPAYLAPEQLTGDVLDARVDQFAWATMAWELLTGVRPFPIIAAIRLDAIRAGLTPPASMPKPMATALVRAMQLAPRDRWPTMRELIDALQAKPAAAHPSRTPYVIGGSALVAVAGTILAWQTLRSDAATTSPNPSRIASTTSPSPIASTTTTSPSPTTSTATPTTSTGSDKSSTPTTSGSDKSSTPTTSTGSDKSSVIDKSSIDKSASPKPGVAPIPSTAPGKTVPGKTVPGKVVPGNGSQMVAAGPPSPTSTSTTSQPPLRPLKNPSYSLARAYATLVAFCRLPMDVKNPDPALGRFGIIDWGTVTKRETVIGKIVDREEYVSAYEVRGARDTYKFDGGSVGAGVFGKLDVPVGQLVALCIDPMRPEKSDIMELPAPWNGGLDLMGSVLPLTAPPLVDSIKSLAPLHIDDLDLSVSGDKGKLKMKPASHYLVEAKVLAADGNRWDMGKWWIEVPKGVKGGDLVAEGKRLWFVIETPVFEPQSDGNKSKLVAKVAGVLEEVLPH